MKHTLVAVALLSLSSVAYADEGTLRVKHDRANSELIFTIGPVDMPPPEHGHVKQPRTQAIAIPVTGFLHGFTTEIVDADGKTLPNVLLHHINIIAPQKRELFSQIMQRIGAAGAETGPVQLPRLIGVPVNEGDSLVFTVMLHNPTDEHYEGAEVRIRMKYSKPSPLVPVIAVQPFYIDVMPPAGYHVYTLPPGKSSKSWQGSPSVPGRVLALGGHMHKYGTVLRLEDVTAKKVLWEVKPTLTADGNIESVPRKFYFGSLGMRLDPRHIYRLTVEYDNPTGKEIAEGGMGTLGGVFAPDERVTWPSVDRAHPEYIADVKVTYARNNAEMVQHHH